MISRSSTIALAFACLATLSLAVAAQVQHAAPVPAARTSTTMTVIDLPRVVVNGQVARNAAP